MRYTVSMVLSLLLATMAQASPEYPIHFQFRVSPDVVKKYAAAESQDMVIDSRALFPGDSISTNWPRAQKERDVAVSGTTTAMIGARFAQEIQKGSPAYAHILAGTNDFYLAGIGGPDQAKMLRDMDSMIEAARKRHIPVIVGTVLPMDFSRSPAAPLIPFYNTLLIENVKHRAIVADYYGAMVLPSGLQNSALFYDGIHPNDAGYAVMDQVLDQALLAMRLREDRIATWRAKRPEVEARSEHRHHRTSTGSSHRTKRGPT